MFNQITSYSHESWPCGTLSTLFSICWIQKRIHTATAITYSPFCHSHPTSYVVIMLSTSSTLNGETCHQNVRPSRHSWLTLKMPSLLSWGNFISTHTPFTLTPTLFLLSYSTLFSLPRSLLFLRDASYNTENITTAAHIK